MFSQMLQRTLDVLVGRMVTGKRKANLERRNLLLHACILGKDNLPSLPTMGRHISAAGTRFRLLACGMSLLQGDVLINSMSKNLLRQRIYSVALDYFCADRSFPTQSPGALKEDIQVE